MKEKRVLLVALVVLLAVSVTATLTLAQGPAPRQPRALAGTAFTYQGQLKSGGGAYTGTCAFQFGLWSDATSLSSQIETTVTVPSVSVANGLFTAPIDLGANMFNGDARYLGIAVACPPGSYTAFSSRQPLTPAPMALALPGLYTQQNATSPNLIGGYSGNVISPTVVGGTIGGGGASGYKNRVWANYATIGGGSNDTASGFRATIGGGDSNTASGSESTIGGGSNNTASGLRATIGGGSGNSASGFDATVGGGLFNTASGGFATVPGGVSNSATMSYTLAAGHSAKAIHDGAFVWGDSTYADFTSTSKDQFLIRAGGGVGIGTNAPATSLQVAKDISGSGNYGQIEAVGATNTAKRLTLGFDTTNNLGWIQASETYVAYRDLALNPNGGFVSIGTLGSAGSTQLCINGSNQIANCSSSLRYKSNIADLNLGLDTVAQLRPVTFGWRGTGEPDLGFVAEEVNQVTPLLTTRNAEGQIEGVKYDRISAVLVNAVQEQQQQIADLKAENAALEVRLTALEQSLGKTPATDVWNNGWMMGALLVAAIMIGTRRSGVTR